MKPESLVSQALSGAGWLGLASIVPAVGWLIVIAVFNRTAPDPVTELASWFVALTTFSLVGLIVECGLPLVLKRGELSAEATAAVSRWQVILGVLGGAGLFVLAGPIGALMHELPAERVASLLRLLAPAVVLTAIAHPPRSILERDLRFKDVSLIQQASSILGLLAALPLALRFGASGFAFAWILRSALEALASWAIAPLSMMSVARLGSFSDLRPHLGYVTGMTLQLVAGTGARILDTIVVEQVVGRLVFIYRSASSFVQQPHVLVTSLIIRIAFPMFARVQHDPERLRRGLALLQRWNGLVLLPSLFGLAAVAPRLMWLFLGPQLESYLDAAVSVLRVLCVGMAAYLWCTSLATVLNAVGAARQMASRQVVGSVAVLGLVALGGALGGVVGSAAGRALAGLLGAGLILQLAASRLDFGWRRALRSLAEEALPSATLMALLVVAFGQALDAWRPGWGTAASHDAAGTAAVSGALALQVGLGVLAEIALLRALGFRPVRELRKLGRPNSAA